MKSALLVVLALLPVVGHAQTCPSDEGITTEDGFRVGRFYTDDLVGVVSLIDVHPAAGEFAPDNGEGLLFTQSTSSGVGAIGRLDSDGNFVDWLVEPSTEFPASAYLTTGHNGDLYACDTVDLHDVWRIEPDGSFEPIADHSNCEGIVYGDIGTGPNVFAGSWINPDIVAFNEDEEGSVIFRSAPSRTVGLALPHPTSAFPMGVYVKQQSGPVNALTYEGGGYDFTSIGTFGQSEEISFSPPDSVFGDYLFALATPNTVLRMDPAGVVSTVASGGALSFSTHTTGAAFSTDGRHYYFTNEESVIWRLSPCDFDQDDDGFDDDEDNCPSIPNDQTDTDEDGFGDACDDDNDGDNTPDDDDNCPLIANDQTDTDDDGDGDACDDDDDNDGTPDTEDNCRVDANQQIDTDEDGRGDVCDDDDDNDGWLDGEDNCSTVANDQTDTDEDAAGDACDDNDDDDAWLDSEDNCRVVANDAQTNSDDDAQGDACDDDDDNDGITDAFDCASTDPTVSAEWTYYADADGDGFGDLNSPAASCTADPPAGFVRDATDNCVDDANPLQADADQDGIGDACDPDDDGDGAADDVDNCALVDNPLQEDTDGDGIGDACDGDEDGDGVDNDVDNCLTIENADQADLDGDDIGDACDPDADGDGAASPDDCDDADASVSDWVALFLDDDGDGVGTESVEVCGESSGYADIGGDNCPDVANTDQADDDEDGQGDACDDTPFAGDEVPLDTADDAPLVVGRCDCSTTPPTVPSAAFLLMALLFARRRRQDGQDADV